MTNALLPNGFRDRLPPEADASARLVRSILDCAGLFGYERAQPPLAEFESSLAAQLKTGTRNVLRFVDPESGETMGIRYDITGQIGRIAATRMAHHPRPVRLSYGGPVVRLRATQLRPEREMLQVGAELIGLDNIHAAIEILSVAVESLKAAGVSDITLDLTMPDLVDRLAAGPLPVDDVESLKARLDAKDAAGVPSAYAPLITAAGPFKQAVARLKAFDQWGVIAERLALFEEIVAALPADITITLDPTERHGFEYQTWLGFSLFSTEASGEIGRGGSYNIGEEPAIGFSVFVDPLIDAGFARNDRRRLFLPYGTDGATAGWLRGKGWVTVAALDAEDSAERQICTHILKDGSPTRV